jgi:hypothetical protein
MNNVNVVVLYAGAEHSLLDIVSELMNTVDSIPHAQMELNTIIAARPAVVSEQPVSYVAWASLDNEPLPDVLKTAVADRVHSELHNPDNQTEYTDVMLDDTTAISILWSPVNDYSIHGVTV